VAGTVCLYGTCKWESSNRPTARVFPRLFVAACVDCTWNYSNVGQQAQVAWTSRSVVGRDEGGTGWCRNNARAGQGSAD
jgi:hypothetical protein